MYRETERQMCTRERSDTDRDRKEKRTTELNGGRGRRKGDNRWRNEERGIEEDRKR